MKRVLPILAAAAAVLALGITPGSAQTRVFVSGTGSDSNPCSLSAPCRSFQQAETTVVTGGEIVALDAAGYGPVIITKAVTVSAIGIEASITSNSLTGAAITIQAGPGDTVALRGLTIIAGLQSNDGIAITAAKSVTIDGCSISGFANDGINVNTSASVDIELRDVTSTNNTAEGLAIIPSGAGAVTAVVTGSTFAGNLDNGVAVDGSNSTGTINATLNVNAAANAQGIGVGTVSGHAVPKVMVTGSKVVNNRNNGLEGVNGAIVFVDRTQITGNGVSNGSDGWTGAGANVKSYTNNQVNGNGTDGLNGVTQMGQE